MRDPAGFGATMRPSANGAGPRAVVLTPASEIPTRPVRFAWKGRFPTRATSVLAGEAGLGKSVFVSANITAHVTRGTLEGELYGQPRDVAIASGEDDWGSVIVPRLVAQGADLSRVHRITVRVEDREELLTLPDDGPRVAAQVDGLRAAGHPVAMLVVDPIGVFLSDRTDSHRDASVRRALGALAPIAQEHDLVILVVAHLNKDRAQKLLHRITGSAAFGNAARSVLVFARDPDDPDGEQGRQRVIVHAKSNWGGYAKSLAARMETRTVDTTEGPAEVGYLNVIGESNVSVGDLEGDDGDDGGADVEEAIAAELADGPRPARDVKKAVMDDAGCSKRTVERAAGRMEQDGALTRESRGFPAVAWWTIPSGDTPLSLLVATRDVATSELPINTGNSTADAPSSDTSPGRDATRPDPRLVGHPEGGSTPDDSTDGPTSQHVECGRPDRHRDRWGPHPVTGRVICWTCHPAPTTDAGDG